jgi:Helix-turn-helix domain
MTNGPGRARFAFMDASETAKRLSIDRVTLEQWVKAGRIKTRGGVGRDVFFRSSEVESLYNELHQQAEFAEAIAADEQEGDDSQRIQGISVPAQSAATRKKQDPQMRVYVRLQADTKWYDIADDDIRAWFQLLSPDGYERNKRNAELTISKLQLIVKLIEDAQQRQANQ